jgi:hypothetical protein
MATEFAFAPSLQLDTSPYAMKMFRMDDFSSTDEARHDIDNLARPTKASSHTDDMKRLPERFQPSPMDVICARGKQAKAHPGNRRFRIMVETSLEKYRTSSSKLDKSLIVSSIVDAVRQASPYGGFVREENGVWYEVGDHVAREKVGQRYVVDRFFCQSIGNKLLPPLRMALQSVPT